MSKSNKKEITVTVKPIYLEEHSAPENDFYIWSYEITIVNNSEDIIQLLNRHWEITDQDGHIEEVEGPGVIGLQPLIKPQRSFKVYCPKPIQFSIKRRQYLPGQRIPLPARILGQS